jgi:predicted  nucleic acid-binding Zn-ribbon protein
MMNISDISLQTCKHAFVIGAFTIATAFGCSSNKNVTKDDVNENIEEAREAVQEAREETQEAIESRKEFTAESRENRINALENRLKDIDNRIEDLKKVAGESTNQSAVTNVNRAIVNLQEEKKVVTSKLEQAKSVEEKDWSTSYTEIDEAVKKMEDELTKLSESLKE